MTHRLPACFHVVGRDLRPNPQKKSIFCNMVEAEGERWGAGWVLMENTCSCRFYSVLAGGWVDGGGGGGGGRGGVHWHIMHQWKSHRGEADASGRVAWAGQTQDWCNTITAACVKSELHSQLQTFFFFTFYLFFCVSFMISIIINVWNKTIQTFLLSTEGTLQ